MTASKYYSYIDINWFFTVTAKINSVKRVRDNIQYSVFQSYVIADYHCMSLHVIRVHLAKLSFAFVVNKETLLVGGIILGNEFYYFYNKLYYLTYLLHGAESFLRS